MRTRRLRRARWAVVTMAAMAVTITVSPPASTEEPVPVGTLADKGTEDAPLDELVVDIERIQSTTDAAAVIAGGNRSASAAVAFSGALLDECTSPGTAALCPPSVVDVPALAANHSAATASSLVGGSSSSASAIAAILTSYDRMQLANRVGVIPSVSGQCGVIGTPVRQYEDDEDRRNITRGIGWFGAWGTTGNTDMRWCSVPSEYFSGVAPEGITVGVNLLGPWCPSFANPLGRYTDSQDINNQNSRSGEIWPNQVFTGALKTSAWQRYYCAFGKSIKSGGFFDKLPDLGFSYGVLSSGSYDGQPTGALFQDNEDSFNTNKWTACTSLTPPRCSSLGSSPYGFISGSNNTGYKFSKVR